MTSPDLRALAENQGSLSVGALLAPEAGWGSYLRQLTVPAPRAPRASHTTTYGPPKAPCAPPRLCNSPCGPSLEPTLAGHTSLKTACTPALAGGSTSSPVHHVLGGHPIPHALQPTVL